MGTFVAKKMTTLDPNYSVLADRVVLFHNALSDSLLVTNMADEGEWRSNQHDNHNDGITRRYEQDIEITRFLPFGKSILEELNTVLKTYASLINSSAHDGRDTIVGEMWLAHVSKYVLGGHIVPHRDEDYTFDNGIYTCIVYLNEDYTGGHVGFTDFDVEIKPSIGDILMFPSYYMHYGTPVTSGSKYMAISRLGF